MGLMRQAFSAFSPASIPRSWGSSSLISAHPGDARGRPRCFYANVPKMHRAQIFLATIGTDDWAMKPLVVISILALITITGAVFTDQLLTSDRETAQRAN